MEAAWSWTPKGAPMQELPYKKHPSITSQELFYTGRQVVVVFEV